MVLYSAGLQKGQTVTAEDFRRAVKRLWDLGVFSDVQIEFNNESSIWKVVFSAKQNETEEIIPYKLEVNSLSGDIANLQMMED